MSDGLKFNIDFGGIDINSVKEAWAKDEAAIQAAINQASKLKLVIKGAEIKGLDEAVKDIQSKIKPVKVEMQAVGLSEYDSKINALQVRLSALRDTFEDIKRQGNLYDDKGLPTAEVQQITAAYSKINLELQEQTKSIQAVVKEEVKRNANIEKRVNAENEVSQILNSEANTLDTIERKIKVINEQRKKSVIGSDNYNTQTNEITRLNAIKAQTVEVDKRRAKEAEVARVLKQEDNTISSIQAKLRVLAQQKDITPFGSATFIKTQAEIDRLTASLNKMQGAGVTAFNSTTKSASNLGFALNGVKQTLGAYASVLGAMRFIDNIREVTAEFELQRVALGAIIQDKAKADQLFAQITQLAVQSPFQVKELITYTKELSAYRIETENLFDTTKRLADISAGLGVDMSRLVLAFGQVKAAQVLRGTELRQFTEAGIDLLPRLAKKFSDMKGEMVSVADVFELISQRAVKFSMVEEIFKDMTDAGGTFYDMQRIQAETLFGSWSNLKDEIALAYNAIGQDNYGLMKGMIDTSRSVVKNMQEIINVSIYAASGFGVLKIAQMGLNKAVGDEAVAMLKSEKAAKSRLAAKLAEKKVLESITQEEQAIIDSSNRLTLADKKRLATNGTLNNTMLTRMFLTGKVSKAELEQLSVITQMEVAEKTRLMNMSKAGRAWDMLKLSISGVVLQLKAMALTLLSNPLTWIIGVVALTMWFTKASREAKKLREELGGIASKGKSSYDDDIYKLKDLQGKLASATKGTKEYTEALSELTNRYGVYLPNISTAIDKNQYLKDSIDGVTESIKNQAKQVALEEARAAVESKNADNIKKYRETAIDNLMEAGKVSRLVATDIVNESFKAIDKVVAEGGEVTAKVISDTVKSVADKKKIQIDLSKLVLPIASGTAAEGAGVLFNSLFDPATKAFDNIASYAKLASSQIDQVAIATGSVISAFREIGDESTEVLMSVQSGIDKMKQASSEAVKAIQASKEYTTDEKALLVYKEQLRLNQEIVDTYKQYPKIISPYQTALDKLIGAQKGLPKTINDYIDSLQGLDQVQKFSLKLQTDEGSLGYFERLNKQIEENTNLLKTNQGQLSTTVISPDARIELTKQNGELELMNAFITMILTKFQQMKGGVSGGGGSGADVRISELKSEISLIETAYKRYKDLAKEIGEDKAKTDVVGLYQPIFDQFKQLKGAKIPFSVKDLNKLIKDGLDMPYIKGKDKLELGVKIPDNDWKELSEQAKAKLDQLQSEIEQQQKANKFFESMLGITGDSQLSANITVGIYGAGFADTATMIKEQLTEAFEGINISLEIGGDVIDYSGLMKKLDDLEKVAGSGARKVAEKLVQDGMEARGKEMQDLLKNLADFTTYQHQRIKIARDAAERIRQINAAPDIPASKKPELIASAEKQERKALAKVDWDEFKDSDLYVKMFENLDRVSTTTLDRLKIKLNEMKTTMGESADPAILKEIASKFETLDKQFVERNPFKTLSKAIEKYKEEGQSLAEAETNYLNTDAEIKKADALLKVQEQLLDASKKTVKTEGGVDITTTDPILESQVSTTRELITLLKARLAVEGEITDKLKLQLLIAGLSLQKIGGEISMVGDYIGKIGGLAEELGADEETVMWINEIGKAISGIGTISQGIGKIISGKDIIGGVGDIVTGLVDTISGVFGASYIKRVKKANEEIKKQGEILENLDKAYSKLQKNEAKALGEDYVKNQQEQISNQQAKAAAIQKQLDAERSKGRKKDKDAVTQYEKALIEAQEAVSEAQLDMNRKITESMLETDLTSTAKNMAKAWLDAYIAIGRQGAVTTDEMKQQWKDMMKNMVSNSLIARSIQAALDPVFKKIDASFANGKYPTSQDINEIIDEGNVVIDQLGTYLPTLLEGLDLSKLSGAADGLTGISKNVAQATEDQITGLAAGINTQNGYFAQTVTLTTNIYALLQKWDAERANGSAGIGTPQLLGIQTSALAQLQAINTNTASTASELVKVNEKLDAVIGVAGVAKSKSITVTLK